MAYIYIYTYILAQGLDWAYMSQTYVYDYLDPCIQSDICVYVCVSVCIYM